MNDCCVACGHRPLSALGRHPDGLLVTCPSCRCLRLHTDKRIDANAGQQYGRAYRAGSDAGKAHRTFELLRKLIPLRSGERNRLLDVGCGDGGFLDLARRDGWNVTGVDCDPEAVRLLGCKGIVGHVGLLGGAMPAGLEGDVVTLWDVIEHVKDIDVSMRWLQGAVRPGGKLIVLTPNADSGLDTLAFIERRLSLGKSQRLMGLCLNRYHLHRFTPAGLRRLVERHGFQVDLLRTLQLFSLDPDRYLSGFAPGIAGWTKFAGLNRRLSGWAYALLKTLRTRNKTLLIASRVADRTLEQGARPEMSL